MNSIYENYLFTKHILVSHGFPEEKEFVLSSLFNKYGIRIKDGIEYLNKRIIKYCSKKINKKIELPFYINFPYSVQNLSEIAKLIDQLTSYYNTYGENDFSKAQHSILENPKTARNALKKEITIKDFTVLRVKDAKKVIDETVKNLCSSTRPLPQMDFNLVKQYYIDNKKLFPIKSKNLAMKLFIDIEDVYFAKYLFLSDVINIANYFSLSYLCTSQKKLDQNRDLFYLSNKSRKILINFFDYIIDNNPTHIDEKRCFEKRKKFVGLLHLLHYKTKNEKGNAFIKKIRTSKVNISDNSQFEKMILKSPVKAAEFITNKKGNGALLRSLDYIISRCKSDDETRKVLSLISNKNPIIFLQLLLRYKEEKQCARIFAYTFKNLLKHHTETAKETKRRKTKLNDETTSFICNYILNLCKENYKGIFNKTYIDTNMKNIALPINESTSNIGLGTLPKGSIVNLPEGKVFRCFTYWEKVNDIDLSLMIIDKNGKEFEFSWRTMYSKENDFIVFSGDQTSGYNGGSEYFDINLDTIRKKYPSYRYIVFNNNVYSGITFDKCFCKAGFMLRKEPNSGEVYEPKTVATSFDINAETTFAHLFAIDILENKLIWLNLSDDLNYSVGASASSYFLTKFFTITKTLNYYDFFKMSSKILVSSPNKADLIVSDNNYDLKENQIQIKSYEIDKVIKYMNYIKRSK